MTLPSDVDAASFVGQVGAHVRVSFRADGDSSEVPTFDIVFRDGMPQPDTTSGGGLPVAHLAGDIEAFSRYLRGTTTLVKEADEQLRSVGRDVGALMVLAGIVSDPRR